MNAVAEALNFWPLNAAWYVPAAAATLVLLLLVDWLLRVQRRRAERQNPSRAMSTAEIRQLRGNDG